MGGADTGDGLLLLSDLAQEGLDLEDGEGEGFLERSVGFLVRVAPETLFAEDPVGGYG